MRKPKKLGSGRVTPIDSSGDGDKWARAVGGQLLNEDAGKAINTRFVPLESVFPDEDQPRMLSVNKNDILKLRQKHPLSKEFVSGGAPEEWWDEYCEQVSQDLGGKALEDYLALCLLAASIGSHTRLLNPITVYLIGSSNRLKIIAGERRYLSHLLLFETVIAARILAHKPNKLEIDILQWEENAQRQGLTLYETIVNIERLVNGLEELQGEPMTSGQLLRRAGIKRTSAHRYLHVIRRRSTLLNKAIKDGSIGSLKQAHILSQMTEAEIKNALNPVPKQVTRKPAFKFGKDAHLGGLREIFEAAAISVCGKRYLAAYSEDDLTTPTGLESAFNDLIKVIEKKRLNNDG